LLLLACKLCEFGCEGWLFAAIPLYIPGLSAGVAIKGYISAYIFRKS
jgi:hypothetical protein